MKFEVIGWTNGDDERFPDHFLEFASVERAVIKALREGGYLFDGAAHQYDPAGTPVLNDGTKAAFGMRAWGYLMAEALSAEDGEDHDYMEFYIDEADLYDQIEEGKPSRAVLPAAGVDRRRILPRKALAEEFEMHLSPAAFEAVVSGKKTADIRLNDEKRRFVCRGDRIVFLCGEKRCAVRVTLEESFSSLGNLFCKKVEPWEDKRSVNRRLALVRRALFPGCETREALYRHLFDIYAGEKLEKICSEGYDQVLFIAFKKEEV